MGSENRQLLADVVSVLSTTVGAKEGVRDALKFRLQVRRRRGPLLTMPAHTHTHTHTHTCLHSSCTALALHCHGRKWQHRCIASTLCAAHVCG